MSFSSVLSLVYAFLGIGIIIFIHELGHFLAAKRAGVRVEKFFLGFDISVRGRRLVLLSFRRGETEYGIGALLFGGYVKMAGESALSEDLVPGEKPKDDHLVGKPPGQRAMVFAAGAAFNIASALIFFVIAFQLGVNLTAPIIGSVTPGKPAWEAGMRAGDQIEAINGKPIEDFYEVALASALGDPKEPRQFRIRRGDRVRDVSLTPTWTKEQGFHTVGIQPTIEVRIPADSATKHGVAEGALFVGVRINGFTVPGNAQGALDALDHYHLSHPGGPFEIGVKEPDRDAIRWVAITLQKRKDPPKERFLGVLPAKSVVESIQPESTSARVFALGDRLQRIDGRDVVSLNWLDLVDAANRNDSVPIETVSITGERKSFTASAAELVAWVLGNDIQWGAEGLRIGKTSTGGRDGLALQEGDLIVGVAGSTPVPVFDAEGLAEAIRSERLRQETGGRALLVRRGDAVVRVALPAKVTSPDELLRGVEWDNAPLVVALPDRPASMAGLASGSRIVEIGKTPIRSWNDLQTAVKESSGDELPVAWIDTRGQRKTATVAVGKGVSNAQFEELKLTHKPVQIRVQAGLLDSFTLGAKRTVVVAKHVFMTLKGLLSRQVEAKNLSGPVGIINLIKQVSEYGLGTLIYFLALISVNLGLFNLLPFPILDGGHLMFLLIEKIKGSPVDVRIQEIATTIAFFLIIGLALFVTFHDIRRLLPGL